VVHPIIINGVVMMDSWRYNVTCIVEEMPLLDSRKCIMVVQKLHVVWRKFFHEIAFKCSI